MYKQGRRIESKSFKGQGEILRLTVKAKKQGTLMRWVFREREEEEWGNKRKRDKQCRSYCVKIHRDKEVGSIAQCCREYNNI